MSVLTNLIHLVACMSMKKGFPSTLQRKLWVAQPAKELAVEVDEEEELMREALAEVRWPCSKV